MNAARALLSLALVAALPAPVAAQADDVVLQSQKAEPRAVIIQREGPNFADIDANPENVRAHKLLWSMLADKGDILASGDLPTGSILALAVVAGDANEQAVMIQLGKSHLVRDGVVTLELVEWFIDEGAIPTKAPERPEPEPARYDDDIQLVLFAVQTCNLAATWQGFREAYLLGRGWEPVAADADSGKRVSFAHPRGGPLITPLENKENGFGRCRIHGPMPDARVKKVRLMLDKEFAALGYYASRNLYEWGSRHDDIFVTDDVDNPVDRLEILIEDNGAG